MARDARVILDFAGEQRVFRLGWGDFMRLQEARDAGPLLLFQRLQSGDWRVEDIAAVIRCGLIGGGMEPAAALKLVRSDVEARPPMENLALATAVLAAGLMGAPDEPPGKTDGEADAPTTSPTSPTANGATLDSTAPAP